MCCVSALTRAALRGSIRLFQIVSLVILKSHENTKNHNWIQLISVNCCLETQNQKRTGEPRSCINSVLILLPLDELAVVYLEFTYPVLLL